MAEMPTGIVTFLFTDIEGSTRLWERQSDAMQRLHDHHDALLRTTIENHGGQVFNTWGDQFCAAFADARDAAEAAVDAQSALYEEVPQIRVRMALHTGAAQLKENDYFGPALSHVSRLLDAGHGGQVLVSQATAARLQLAVPPDTRLDHLGTHRLRDIPDSETIFHLSIQGLPHDFPPLNTLDVAFRRGVKRAAAVSAVVLVIMAALTLSSVQEKHRADRNALTANRLLALGRTEQGVRRLEAGDSLGLLDLIEARRTAEQVPELQEPIATVWAGWHQALAGRLIGAVGHDQAVLDMAFSPDGTRLATASEDKTVRLWDTRTWELAARPLPHARAVDSVLFSPDGKLLATVAGDRVRLWDVATGEPRGGPMEHGDLRHGEGITSVAFSPDGKLLASGCLDGTARLWDTGTNRPRGRSLRPDGSSVQSGFGVLVGFGPPPENLLIAATDRSVSLWNPESGKPLDRLLRREHASSIEPVLASSRDGTVRAIAFDRMVWLWNPADRRFRGDLIRDAGHVDRMGLSPDGSLLATAGADEAAAQLWDTSTGNRIVSPLLHPANAEALVFGPPGSRLLVTRSRGILRFWDTSTGKPYPDPPPALDVVKALALSPDGRTLAAAAANGTVHLWAVPAQPPCRRLALPSGTLGIASVEGGAAFATYSGDGLRLWSAETGQLLSRHPGPGRLLGGAFSQDGQFLAEWGGTNVTVWQTQTGRPHGPPLHLSQPVRSAALSRHGTVLATTSRSNTVELWDAASKRSHGTVLPHPTSGAVLEFSPDESLLATVEGDQLYLWDTSSGRLHVPPIRLAGPHRWVVFSPDSRMIAAVNQDGDTVTLWIASTGRPCLRLKHAAPVERGAFSPDGKMLATVTAENTVHLWDLTSGQSLGKPMPHPNFILAVGFSPDGKRLLTASQSGARLWDVKTCQLASRPVLATEPIWEAKFGLNGSVLALSGGQPESKVYLWRLPTSPASLAAMELLTTNALGVGPGPGGSGEVLPWRQWRALHQGVSRPAAQIESAAPAGRRALHPGRPARPPAPSSRQTGGLTLARGHDQPR